MYKSFPHEPIDRFLLTFKVDMLRNYMVILCTVYIVIESVWNQLNADSGTGCIFKYYSIKTFGCEVKRA